MATMHVIERGDFQPLFDALSSRGHTIVGPTVRDRAIVYDEIRSVDDLPVGWTDRQDAGSYRLERRLVVARNLDLTDEQLTLRCEQAIRNHDPCISCSTHFLDLTIER